MQGLRGMSIRKACIQVWAWIRGVRIMWVTDANVARAVLRASTNKGEFIEEQIATPAWSPILSIESTGGAEWAELRHNFALVHARLPSKQHLEVVIREEVHNRCANLSPTTALDANDIAALVLCSVVRWLFGIRLTDAEVCMLVQASWEWRSEIAMKGHMCRARKDAVVSWMVNLLRDSTFANLQFHNGRDVSDPLVYSVFLQPFILSPMINIGDVAVTWFTPQPANTTMAMTPEQRLRASICHAHPFPVLERWIDRDLFDARDPSRLLVRANCQVFIPLDEMSGSNRSSVMQSEMADMSFGAGPRACSGERLAITMMLALFDALEESGMVVSPKNNHFFSGRHNDQQPNFSWKVLLCQLGSFWRICRCMFQKRMAGYRSG